MRLLHALSPIAVVVLAASVHASSHSRSDSPPQRNFLQRIFVGGISSAFGSTASTDTFSSVPVDVSARYVGPQRRPSNQSTSQVVRTESTLPRIGFRMALVPPSPVLPRARLSSLPESRPLPESPRSQRNVVRNIPEVPASEHSGQYDSSGETSAPSIPTTRVDRDARFIAPETSILERTTEMLTNPTSPTMEKMQELEELLRAHGYDGATYDSSIRLQDELFTKQVIRRLAHLYKASAEALNGMLLFKVFYVSDIAVFRLGYLLDGYHEGWATPIGIVSHEDPMYTVFKKYDFCPGFHYQKLGGRPVLLSADPSTWIFNHRSVQVPRVGRYHHNFIGESNVPHGSTYLYSIIGALNNEELALARNPVPVNRWELNSLSELSTLNKFKPPTMRRVLKLMLHGAIVKEPNPNMGYWAYLKLGPQFDYLGLVNECRESFPEHFARVWAWVRREAARNKVDLTFDVVQGNIISKH